MGARERRKGARGEVEVCRLLRPIYPEVATNRSLQAQRAGGADIVNVPWTIEVKLQKKPNIYAAYQQAKRAGAYPGGPPPIAFTRRDNDEWLVTMSAYDFIELLGRLK